MIAPIDIKKTRQQLGLSQQKAAASINVSLVAWQQWESGKRKIREAFWELFLIKNNLNNLDVTLKNIHKEYSQKDIRNKQKELSLITHHKEIIQNKKYTFIDLFAGIGGIRQAFSNNNCGCVFSSEIDPFAQFTYYTNFGVVPFGDIIKIESKNIPEHDILCAGFPCQPFSNIGKREGFLHPTQGTMFHEVLRIITDKKPKAIFLENVQGILSHDNGNTLKIIFNELKKINYKCQYTVINAKDYGVPQSRSRFYLVGFLNNVEFNFPNPPMIHADIGNYIESDISGYSISEYLQKSYLFKKEEGRPAIVDKNSKGSIKTLVSTYHKIQRLTGTFVKGGNTGLRLLSENECKSIMGFPTDYIIPVSRTQMYRQMGNSVVIPVIESIAKEMVRSLTYVYREKDNASSLQSDRERQRIV
ncbi:DNA (cytosine-5-)-methyltransferase [Candidatus Enterovibrio escicola]|nr:DNA (cytosine-5-)-methyltransferase [Candidatus Enterovibrio escacola]